MLFILKKNRFLHSLTNFTQGHYDEKIYASINNVIIERFHVKKGK